MLQILVIISTFLTLILAFALGIFTIIKNPKAKVNILWFLTMMAVSVWAVGYVLVLFSTDDATAAKTLKIVYLGATFVPILFFHFVASFLYQDRKFKLIIIFGYISATVMTYLAVATTYIIKGVKFHEVFGRHEEVTGTGFYLYLAYFLTFMFLGLILLIQGYVKSDGIRKKQIFYILAASVIAFIGGTSNFVTDLTGIYPYGQMIIWVFPLLITYGVFIQDIKLKINT